MQYGLYLSAQGAETQALRQSILANNMANAGTTGFKPDIPLFRSHLPYDVLHQPPNAVPDTLDRQTGGVELVGTVTDHRQGPLNVTNAQLDLAVVGNGFLQVSNGKDTFLTRDGHFTLDANGKIVAASDGAELLATDGQPIVIPPETQNIAIAADGLVSGTSFGGTVVPLGQLAIVEPDNYAALKKEGNNHYTPTGSVRPSLTAQVRQGVLEESAMNPVEGMVELIQTARAFEMNTSMIQYQDQMLSQLIQSVPRR